MYVLALNTSTRHRVYLCVEYIWHLFVDMCQCRDLINIRWVLGRKFSLPALLILLNPSRLIVFFIESKKEFKKI